MYCEAAMFSYKKAFVLERLSVQSDSECDQSDREDVSSSEDEEDDEYNSTTENIVPYEASDQLIVEEINRYAEEVLHVLVKGDP
ncbi:hypothetical protein JTB14_033598 [Gonioctena quinquepunctata]|nr:hypothetical protein JTB14_033598 [Gonioctena quinquepunctata]